VHEKVDGYNICFNFAAGWEAHWTGRPPYFVREGEGHSFAGLGTVVVWERVKTPDVFPLKVLLTDNWRFEDCQVLEVKETPD
jgi:hypothetical protein